MNLSDPPVSMHQLLHSAAISKLFDNGSFGEVIGLFRSFERDGQPASKEVYEAARAKAMELTAYALVKAILEEKLRLYGPESSSYATASISDAPLPGVDLPTLMLSYDAPPPPPSGPPPPPQSGPPSLATRRLGNPAYAGLEPQVAGDLPPSFMDVLEQNMDARTFDVATALLDGSFVSRLAAGTGKTVSRGELMYLIGGVFEVAMSYGALDFYTSAAADGGYAKYYYELAIEVMAPCNVVPDDPSWSVDEYWALTRKASYAIVRVKLVSAYRDEVYDQQIDPSESNNFYSPPKYVGGYWPAGHGPYALPAPASAVAEYEAAPSRRYKTSSAKASKVKVSPAVLLNKRVEIIIGDHTGIHGFVTETTSRGWIRLDLDREPGETRLIYNTRPSWVQVLADQNGPSCTKLTVYNRSNGKPTASMEGAAAAASAAPAVDGGNAGGVVAVSEASATEAGAVASVVAQQQDDEMEMERSGTSTTSVDFELYTEPNTAEGAAGAEGGVETAGQTATASARAGVGPQLFKTE